MPVLKSTVLREAVTEPALDVQVSPKVQLCPAKVLFLYSSLNSKSSGRRHPVWALMVVLVQKSLALAQVAINETGIQTCPPNVTKLPGRVKTVHTPFVKVAGKMHVLALTVNNALMLPDPHLPVADCVAVRVLVPTLTMVTVLPEIVATAVLLLV